jgi:two-component system nitrogen regulation sensor histidine kinase NtrY
LSLARPIDGAPRNGPLVAYRQRPVTQMTTTAPPEMSRGLCAAADRLWVSPHLGFWLGFGLAGLLAGAAIVFALSGAMGASDGPAGPIVFALLGVSLLISAALGAGLAHRIIKIARSGASPQTGARLHLRFVSLFSAAAVIPAILVAAFLGVLLSRGVEQWFSERVRTVMESAADVGRLYASSFNDDISTAVTDMATDLNRAPSQPDAAPREYEAYLRGSLDRRFLSAAYIIASTGRVMVGAEAETAPPFEEPARCDAPETPARPGDAFVDAGAGISVCLYREQAVVRALYKLAAFDDAYLYVVARVDPTLLSRLDQFDRALNEYRDSESARGRLQLLFALIYLATAILVLLGAVWLGLYNARRVSEPIGNLADAALQVAAGDLGARVLVSEKRDEIAALGSAFNLMTAQLQTQQGALVKARLDAENRSHFTEAVLSGVSAGVIGLDPQGRVTACNASAAALLGIERRAAEGRRLVEAAPEFTELLASLTESAPVARRIDLVRNGTHVHLSVRVSHDEGGAVLTFDDMTKLIAAQRQEAWKDVARRIAHEIKNPLTPIQLSAERLQRKYGAEVASDPETFRRCTDTILRQVNDIGRMVDEFSAFARMPMPKMEPADLADLARAAVFAQRLGASDTRFTLTTPEQVVFACDGRLIAQVMTNLLKNAQEAIQTRRTREGEPKEGLVNLTLRETHETLEIIVEDNGVGFPAVGREQLVEPYVTTRSKGTGLGLAIVRRVIEDHGGDLQLRDAPPPGPGACVVITLPKTRKLPQLSGEG